MNESSLLINSAFALRQQDSKPVYTQIGERIESPYTESELKDLKEKLIKLYTKTGLSLENIAKRTNNFETSMKGKTKKTDGKTDYPLDLNKLERILLTPKASGYISTAFIDFMKEHSIPIYWIDGKGTIDASFIPFDFKKASLIVKQVEARNNGKSLLIAKYLIKLKIESEDMKAYLPKLNKAKDIKEVMEVEALASANYFKKWKFDKEWNYSGRQGKNKNKSAVDPVNTMLNLGYGLLAQRMSEILLKRGFELSIGFLHAYDATATWNRLTYDFIEPYRTWIDIKVFELIHGLRIKLDDFVFKEDKSSMILKDEAFDIALEEFMDVLKLLEYKSLPMIREIEKIL